MQCKFIVIQIWKSVSAAPAQLQQGHHYNGDQAARRPPHDVLNLFSPTSDPSIWSTRGQDGLIW